MIYMHINKREERNVTVDPVSMRLEMEGSPVKHAVSMLSHWRSYSVTGIDPGGLWTMCLMYVCVAFISDLEVLPRKMIIESSWNFVPFIMPIALTLTTSSYFVVCSKYRARNSKIVC